MARQVARETSAYLSRFAALLPATAARVRTGDALLLQGQTDAAVLAYGRDGSAGVLALFATLVLRGSLDDAAALASLAVEQRRLDWLDAELDAAAPHHIIESFPTTALDSKAWQSSAHIAKSAMQSPAARVLSKSLARLIVAFLKDDPVAVAAPHVLEQGRYARVSLASP